MKKSSNLHFCPVRNLLVNSKIQKENNMIISFEEICGAKLFDNSASGFKPIIRKRFKHWLAIQNLIPCEVILSSLLNDKRKSNN